jgi:hypothetical protein
MNQRQRKAAVVAKRRNQNEHCDRKRRAKALARLRNRRRNQQARVGDQVLTDQFGTIGVVTGVGLDKDGNIRSLIVEKTDGSLLAMPPVPPLQYE